MLIPDIFNLIIKLLDLPELINLSYSDIYHNQFIKTHKKYLNSKKFYQSNIIICQDLIYLNYFYSACKTGNKTIIIYLTNKYNLAKYYIAGFNYILKTGNIKKMDWYYSKFININIIDNLDYSDLKINTLKYLHKKFGIGNYKISIEDIICQNNFELFEYIFNLYKIKNFPEKYSEFITGIFDSENFLEISPEKYLKYIIWPAIYNSNTKYKMAKYIINNFKIPDNFLSELRPCCPYWSNKIKILYLINKQLNIKNPPEFQLFLLVNNYCFKNKYSPDIPVLFDNYYKKLSPFDIELLIYYSIKFDKIDLLKIILPWLTNNTDYPDYFHNYLLFNNYSDFDNILTRAKNIFIAVINNKKLDLEPFLLLSAKPDFINLNIFQKLFITNKKFLVNPKYYLYFETFEYLLENNFIIWQDIESDFQNILDILGKYNKSSYIIIKLALDNNKISTKILPIFVQANYKSYKLSKYLYSRYNLFPYYNNNINIWLSGNN